VADKVAGDPALSSKLGQIYQVAGITLHPIDPAQLKGNNGRHPVTDLFSAIGIPGGGVPRDDNDLRFIVFSGVTGPEGATVLFASPLAFSYVFRKPGP
jgi:hypothetical protein